MSKLGVLTRMQVQALFGRAKSSGGSLPWSGIKKKAMTIFIAVGVTASLISVGVIMFMAFNSMTILCRSGLTWLYFALAGLTALCLCIFGSVMMAENLLFGSKDNDLLLSMPLNPGSILASRMAVLFGLNFVMSALILALAGAAFLLENQPSLWGIVGFVLSLVCVPIMGQVLVCLFGWVLHMVLSKVSSSIASLVFIVIFFVIYFWAIGNGNEFLAGIITNGQAIGGTIKTAIWPVYLMGRACEGSAAEALLLLGVTAVIGAISWAILSATFLKVSTLSKHEKKREYSRKEIKLRSAIGAVAAKEFRHFLASSVYLTNMGIGIVLMIMMTVGALAAKSKVLAILSTVISMDAGINSIESFAVFAVIGFLLAMTALTAPSISLEGKNLWILKSMPISSKEILMGKMGFHLMVILPPTIICTLVITLVLGCPAAEILMLETVFVLLAAINGITGLLSNLRFYNFGWLSEVVPCKQGISVLINLFAMWVLVIAGAGAYLLLKGAGFLTVFGVYALFLGVLAVILWKALMNWGTDRWDGLE